MSWSSAGSGIFRTFIEHNLAFNGAVKGIDLLNDGLSVALYGNSALPEVDPTGANDAARTTLTKYDGADSAWVTANEKYQAGKWAQGGIVAEGMSLTSPATGVIMFDIDDTSSTASDTTLTDVYGSLLYCTEVAAQNQGVCFNYFGGPNSVSNGTLTIVWHVNGLFRITV
jgi:hypothetical protein